MCFLKVGRGSTNYDRFRPDVGLGQLRASPTGFRPLWSQFACALRICAPLAAEREVSNATSCALIFGLDLLPARRPKLRSRRRPRGIRRAAKWSLCGARRMRPSNSNNAKAAPKRRTSRGPLMLTAILGHHHGEPSQAILATKSGARPPQGAPAGFLETTHSEQNTMPSQASPVRARTAVPMYIRSASTILSIRLVPRCVFFGAPEGRPIQCAQDPPERRASLLFPMCRRHALSPCISMGRRQGSPS